MGTSPRLSRRAFLNRTAGAVGAGIAFPYFIPGGVLSAPGRPGANDRIGVGHIGVGGRGLGLLRESRKIPDAVSVAVCDVDAKHLARAAETAGGGARSYADYRRLLEDPDVDVVIIGTPDHWHALNTIHACQAGKDVYCEKPACNTIAEGRAMIRAVRRHDRIVQIGSQGRSHPHTRAACDFIRNGRLGKVSRVTCWHPLNREGGFEPDSPPPEHVDWEMWLGPAAARPFNPALHPFGFRWVLDLGGGNIRDRGAHIFSNALWLLDADAADPVSIEALGAPPRRGLYDTPTLMQVTYEFKNPDWTLVWEQPGARPEPGLQDYGALFHGEQDTLWLEKGDGGCRTEEKALAFQPPPGGSRAYQSPGHMADFFNSVRSRKDPIMPVEAGVKVADLCILGNLSYLLRRKLAWDGANRRFVGDEEANRLLAAPGRGEWVI